MIKEIEKAYKEASPGPWTIFIERNEAHERVHLHGPKHWKDNRLSLKDARFIALAHMIMPKLLAIAKIAKSDAAEYPGTSAELADAVAELEKE